MKTLYCLQMYLKTHDLPGDVIELGVAKGDTAFPLANLMQIMRANKKLYACDTFTGIPYDDAIVSDAMCKKGEINCGNVFKDVLNIRKDPNIVCVEGLIENTLVPQLGINKFCFAWVDLDLYQSTSFGYKFLEDRMVPGGIIGFHDYKFFRCPGIERVVDQELNRQKYKEIFNEHTCVFFRRV